MKFASQDDLKAKKISFPELAEGVFGFTAEGDPNSGVIIGEESVMVIEAQATPALAQNVISKIKAVTNKPIKYLVLTHYHAVRVLGASAYQADEIICSEKTLEMINERGMQDWASEFQRFPRLFDNHESIPGLTYPTKTFKNKMTLDLGNKPVEILHLGEGHTRGDAVVWLPNEKILFAGDLVEYNATPYCGDAQLKRWPHTLDAISNLSPHGLVPGRGDALTNKEKCNEAISNTKSFVTTLLSLTQECVLNNYSLKECYNHVMKIMEPQFGHWVIFKHCMCFNVTRAYEELNGLEHPKIWTDKRDLEMWESLN